MSTDRYACPTCKADDRLDVQVQTWARLIQEPDNIGTDTDAADDHHQEWNDSNYMKCCACNFFGLAREFRLPHGVPKAEPEVDPVSGIPF